MNKLEQYLDQVCQSIGGPWELRQHVRQEMREHLLDAIAQHKAAGMTEEQALDQALTEFGKPDEVRSELESTYGRRTTWIIDKALEWKEKTMRAKWLWTTWAYLALVTVIGLEIAFISFVSVFIIPKFRQMVIEGLIDSSTLEMAGVSWMPTFLFDLANAFDQYGLITALIAGLLWALFEWRIHSENKSLMRFAGFGTIAVGLLLIIMTATASLVIPFCLAMPLMVSISRPWAIDRVAGVEPELIALEKAYGKKDWPDMQEHAARTSSAIRFLTFGPTSASLAKGNEQMKSHEIRNTVNTMQHWINHVQESIRAHNEKQLDTSLQELRKAYEPLRDAAKKLER
jgi:hypothetical protein